MTSHTIFDWDRSERTGVPEVVLAEHKTVAQLSDIVTAAMSREQPLLMTRLTPAQIEGLGAPISRSPWRPQTAPPSSA
jgi:pyridinium-3,5-biscarboxylic acid mononucleotide synthase